MYKTLPGLGKTTMILGICEYIKKSNLDIGVIFCCSDILESVRVQVLRTMYNFGIKFGIGTGILNDNISSYKITNSWNCSKDEDRKLIVADYITTYNILKENKKNYLLFFDEPTVHTDNLKYTTTLEYLTKILYYMPKYSILSSATLPQITELQNIINNYKIKNPDALISEIVSNKTLTGCVIKDFNDNVISPHSQCKNGDELKKLLNKLKQFPLLGKFYTLPFLINLNEFMKKFNQNIDLDSIESFEQTNILENIIVLLEKVSLFEQTNFNDFLNIKIQDINEENFDKDKLDLKYKHVCVDKLLTTHAYKYIGCCLIATNNPYNYAKNNLYNIVNKLKEKVNIKNINNDFDKYKKNLKKFEEEIDTINQKFTQDTKIDEELEKIMHKKPSFIFPSVLELNTHSHIETFAKYVKSYDSSLLKVSLCHEDIDITNFNIDEELKFLLFMGVGLYSKDLDHEYCNLILELLTERKLAYIIADESFCYGANYQISNVIINDDLGDCHSINTILQLIGRTGRVGKSWLGKVYLDTNTCNRITKFFNDPNDYSNEGKNISDSFNHIINVIKKENEIFLQKEQELELLKIKQQKLLESQKLKELEIKTLKLKESKNKILEEEMYWKNARNCERITQKTHNIFTSQFNDDKNTINDNSKIYKIPTPDLSDEWGNLRNKTNSKLNSKNNQSLLSTVDSNDWKNLRNKKEIISTNNDLYKIGSVNPSTDLTQNKLIQTPINKNFREIKEDEIFNTLFAKKKSYPPKNKK
jgi:hypothetical protein